MIATGNILIGLASLIFLTICSLLYGNSPRGGDAGVSFAWALLFSLAGFVLVLGTIVIIVTYNNGFNWISSTLESKKSLIVFCGFALSMWGIIVFTFGGSTGDFPKSSVIIFKLLPSIAFLSVLIGAIILVNYPEKLSLPNSYWRWPIYTSVGLGIVAFIIVLAIRIHHKIDNYKYYKQFENQQLNSRLTQIDTIDVFNNFGALLMSTDAYQELEVRMKALDKIKSHPEWENEMLRYLKSEWAPNVFTFLASNDVNSKELFADAINEGIEIQTQSIKNAIAKCKYDYELYTDRFSWEVDRILRTVDKFNDSNVDYQPAIQGLRNVFDEPTPVKKPELTVTKMLDKWLKENMEK